MSVKISSAADLDKLYTEAEQVDKTEFSKMRSSLLLIAGEHYNKSGSRFERIRSARNLSEDVKLRLTKNHIGKIARRYSNIICRSAPGCTVAPKHEKELQDKKDAELYLAIMNDIKEKHDWSDLVMNWVDDFVGIGEVWTLGVWDEFAGDLMGHAQMVNEVGEPMVDEMGQPVADMSKPVYTGEFKFEEVYGFNVLRDPCAQSVQDSPYLFVRKSVKADKLKAMFPKMQKSVADLSNEPPFLVFDASSGYRRSDKNDVLVKYLYVKKCPEYPKGYYFISIGGEILAQDELPKGIFPLRGRRFENIQTRCRGMACTEPLRPNQAEINRSASAMATHQITLGDDKLVVQNGAKISAGATLPGIRTITTTGGKPDILPGRSGEQYMEYMLANIKEMYEIAEVNDEDVEGNLEPHTLLYRSASKTQRFQRYISRFESFLKDAWDMAFDFAKAYYTDERFVMAVGRNERINIAEFRDATPLSTQIVLEPQADDIETKMGRQLVITNVLQYVGNQLSQSQIGKLIREMPYANVKSAFSDLTLDDENATNDLLALDRGEMPMFTPNDPHEYLVSRASARMREADFRYLPEEVQANYQAYIEMHMKMVQEQKEALMRAQSGLIPDGGALVGVDFYVQDPNNPERTRRARFPYDSVAWLAQKLDEQGTFKKIAGTIAPGAFQLAEQTVPDATGSQAEVSSAPPPSSATL